MSKLTQRLLNRAADLAELQSKVQSDLTEAFRERYGTTYSDVNADEIIDVLDYHGGHITLSDVDEIMTKAGYPPRKG
ncbi:hypothetical protein KEU06_09290 [Pseudaminobacter sp. 19-2017]|uniref:Uncharacterized protein n=1 Tax=Pseudaminobacter soli (ex Zhang et al. 2022) TaxID=2831468 RepID=A0A942I2I5_9HYPH|nr:hypothetical protein [Pseudaminobacter soli]MBS3648798.1 hypothetical protein [Pseudaminobacter soli]